MERLLEIKNKIEKSIEENKKNSLFNTPSKKTAAETAGKYIKAVKL